MRMSNNNKENRSGIYNVHDIRLHFMASDDVWEFTVLTPTNVSHEELKSILVSTHKMLMEDYEQDKGIYYDQEYNPIALLDYICEENGSGWSWEDLSFDLELEL